jgi:ligand-binding SRPBCC domain-containing protein
MKTLRFEQFLPLTIEEAWKFFSNPANLDLITPTDLKFQILDALPEKIHKGLIIRYRIKPMLNIPMNWVTEITAMEEFSSFTDEQIRGPYKVWRHQHQFRTVEGGVVMTDILDYEIGLGPLGWLAGKLWVDKQVRHIFDFRKNKLIEIFELTQRR